MCRYSESACVIGQVLRHMLPRDEYRSVEDRVIMSRGISLDKLPLMTFRMVCTSKVVFI